MPCQAFHNPETKETIMLQRKLVVLALAGVSLLASGYALAEDENQSDSAPQVRQQQQVRGSQVMTREERMEHRREMRKARTKEERERVRKEQHERMKERAKKQGKSMPDEPPASGMGMGRGNDGSGRGMGPGGGGMGPGGGMGGGGNRGR